MMEAAARAASELQVCSYLSVLLPQIPQMGWSGEGFRLHISCSTKIRDQTERVPPSLPPHWFAVFRSSPAVFLFS